MSKSENDPRESADDVSPEGATGAGGRHEGTKRGSRGSRDDAESYRHTRTSAAWAAVGVAILFGIALVDFIAQNTGDVRIEFFGASGRMPIAVALLVAALAGAGVVLAIGVGRVAQLRFNLRRRRRRENAANSASVERDADNARDDDEGPSGR